MSYDVLMLSRQLSPLGKFVVDFFHADCIDSEDAVEGSLAQKDYRVVIFDQIESETLELTQCEALLKKAFMQTVPLVLISCSTSVQDKIKALEIGCDDFVDCKTEPDEVCARITRSIYHQIARTQLSKRLIQATETARSALIDNSDLGANIQFLLQAHNCDNLDELGQQFFATIQRYGLSCSLQMRSSFAIKNMEAHGMAKDLESQLLLQLKDRGRYVDFGRRSIINYDRVSLLIKNMPHESSDKYGAIKDNTFCLAQGMNARIVALEDRQKLMDEKESLRKLSVDVKTVMATLKNSYQNVMTKIVNNVEQVTEQIQLRMPALALTESDEKFLEGVTDGLILSTNKTFNEGLKTNELCDRLDKAVQRSLDAIGEPSPQIKTPINPSSGNSVELF
jgi:CheY-like chemotaxis protein